MSIHDSEHVQLDDRASWRAWLEANHATSSGVWLVTWRSRARRTEFPYDAAVEEALCFGWVDGACGVVDDERGKQYFAPRKPRSGWAAANKARVARLMAEGQTGPAGLAAALSASPPAHANFAAFPPSARKLLVAWIVQARRPETRAARIGKIAQAAERNDRADR